MFKLLKSKKGFTLVELMIVVVIMAILVAVAVPIFSAVTSNAKKKTCAANQREIQAQFSNAEMSDIITFTQGDVFTLSTDGDGNPGAWKKGNAAADSKINDLFQKVPYCPEDNATITVTIGTITTAGDDGGIKVTTNCSIEGHENYKAS